MRQSDARKATGLTQRAFAARVGIHPITACRYENGGIPPPKVMRRILNEFPEIDVASYYRGKRAFTPERESTSHT